MCNARCRRGKKEGCRVITRGNVFAREPTNHVPVIYLGTIGFGGGLLGQGGQAGVGWGMGGKMGKKGGGAGGEWGGGWERELHKIHKTQFF
jgi:hypothetical protein